MRFTTTGHAAWMFAAGLCVSAALFPASHAAAQDAAQAPEQPAVGSATGVTAAPAEPTRLHPKKSASKPRKAERQAKAKKPAKEETAKAEELKPSQDDTMSPAVANANAQWANEAKPTDTYNMSAQAGNVLSQMGAQPDPHATAAAEESAPAEQVVAADQLNELDRAAEQQPPLTLAKATIDTPPAPAPSATVENSKPWEQTSMIGKVFIALGGLLTLASAARMFMA
jgi:nitrogen fixation protein FixH